jgi:soluble lytic murein transglycosylase-like protein
MDNHCRIAGGAVKALGAAFLLALSSPAGAGLSEYSDLPRIDRWALHIKKASARFGIPETWIRRVMRAESGGRTTLGGRPITSSVGAMGLMQLMPGTWAEMRAKHGLGPDPHDPSDNILAGTAYLRAMFDRFGYPGLFAAYNAGPGRYAEHLAGGRRLPAETIFYVAAIGSTSGRAAASRRKERAQAAIIFAPRASAHPGKGIEELSAPAPADALFVRLSADRATSE